MPQLCLRGKHLYSFGKQTCLPFAPLGNTVFASHVMCFVTLHVPLCDPLDCSPPGSSVCGGSSGKNAELGFQPSSRGSSQPRDRTQVSHTAADSLQSEHQGSIRILEWIAYPFSRESSPPWNRTRISCIAGGFFTI